MNFKIHFKDTGGSKKKRSIGLQMKLNPKNVLAMKLTLFFIMVFSVTAFSSSFSQQVTLSVEHASLSKVMQEIRKQTGYSFIVNDDYLKQAKEVTANLNQASLEESLKTVFKHQPFTYTISEKTIVLKLIKLDKQVDLKANAQKHEVTGVITSKTNGSVIPGVTVLVKGTKKMTQTDAKGAFSINVSGPNQVLIVRSIGYKIREFNVGNFKHFEISLEDDDTELEQVVITGLFERPEGNFTGATKSISGAELKSISSNNIFTGIAALDPSFQIVANNVMGGSINQLPDIQLRGQNSFPNLSGELSSNPNLPLFILDGFEVNLQRVVDLDMNMIANITILKDASATSIYGSRGANGVMVISTLAPAPGKIQVTVNNDFRLSTPDLSVYNYLNAAEKLDFEKRVGVYESSFDQGYYRMEQLYNERLKNITRGIDTDWKKIPTQVGYNNRTSINLQGGDEKIRYGVLAAADMQEGVMKGQTRDNYSGQFDLTYLVNKLQFKNSVRIYQNTANESPYGDFSKYLNMNPYWSPYDINGNVQRYVEDYLIVGQSFRTSNPLYDATLHSLNNSKYFGFTNNLQIKYNVSANFFLESSLSLSKQAGASDQFYSAEDSRFESIQDINRKGSYTARNDDSHSYESTTNLNYNLKKGKHQWFSTASFNASSATNSFKQTIAEGFPYDRLDNLLFANQYQENGRPTGDESTVRRLGILYNGNYSYDNRFLFDVSVKRDGSSQYGSDRRFGTFWSTGIGWNVHNEKYIQDIEFINRLKIRSSYGSTGSLNIPAYSAQTRYNFGVSSGYYNELGGEIANLGNHLLSWQNVNKLNIGLDIILFHSRLDLKFDAYRDVTDNALTQITLAPSTGFSSFSENLGKVQNTGFEFSARYKVIENRTTGTLWSMFVNGFTNKNILKELSNRLKASNDRLNEANTNQSIPNILFEEGQSMNSIFVVRSLGVDPSTGSEIYLTREGVETFDWNAADKVAYGISQPKWNGNFGTNLMHKGFELGVIFNGQFGGQLYNQTLIDKVESVNPRNNVDRRAHDLGWTMPGDQSQFTRIGLNTVPTRLTSRFVQDNNTLSLTTLSLGYNFYQQAWIKRAGFRSLQLTAITNDLMRISSIELERGTSNPFARTFSLSIRLGL